MPAPNIATILDWETAYEGALRNYFQNVQLGAANAFVQVLTPATMANIAANVNTSYLLTPRLQIKMSASSTGLEEVTGAATNGNYFYNEKQATIVLDVASRRDSTQNHGLLRGLTRQGMLSATAALNPTTNPYFQTLLLIETNSVQGVDAENEEIITSLTYQVKFAIIASQFPAS